MLKKRVEHTNRDNHGLHRLVIMHYIVALENSKYQLSNNLLKDGKQINWKHLLLYVDIVYKRCARLWI